MSGPSLPERGAFDWDTTLQNAFTYIQNEIDAARSAGYLIPAFPNDSSKFLRGDGTWATATAVATDASLTTSDITTNDVSTSKHGFAPKAPGGTTSFLRADGTWAAPAASSGDTSSNTATSVDGEAVVFNGTTGKSVKRATGSGVAKLTSGVLSTAAAGSDYSAGTSGLATGILKSTTSTGALSIATAGTDYSTLALTATTPSALGTAAVGASSTAAKADHVHPTTGLALLTENINTVATSSTAQTIPAVSTATVNSITLTANCTLTFPTATAGTSFLLRLAQDATGSRTVTWPASVKWAGAVAPTLSTGVSKVDYLTFVCVDGSTWFGSVAGLDVR